MEDKKKESLSGLIKSLDEGNLFVLKFECIPFLESFSKVFLEVVNQEGYNLLGNKLFKVSINPLNYQIYVTFWLGFGLKWLFRYKHLIIWQRNDYRIVSRKVITKSNSKNLAFWRVCQCNL